MFDKQELKEFIRQGKMSAQVAAILEQAEEREPVMMQYWVYRKRIKPAPLDVAEAAMSRFVELAIAAGVELNLSDFVAENVYNAIWDRMDPDELHQLMHSIS